MVVSLRHQGTYSKLPVDSRPDSRQDSDVCTDTGMLTYWTDILDRVWTDTLYKHNILACLYLTLVKIAVMSCAVPQPLRLCSPETHPPTSNFPTSDS